MGDFLLDLLFPRWCLGCGRFGKYLCPDCAATKIEYFTDQVCPYCERPSPYGFTHPRCRSPRGLDGLFTLAHYHGLIPKLIHEVKYQGVYSLTAEIAAIIFANYHHHFPFDYFVPVPLSAKRANERGFNQAEKLAASLNKHFQNAKVINALSRIRETKPQFGLSMDDRRKNLMDAFSLNQHLGRNNLSGISFCLVDDVATTGATLFECAKVLKKSGAAAVWAITIARGG